MLGSCCALVQCAQALVEVGGGYAARGTVIPVPQQESFPAQTSDMYGLESTMLPCSGGGTGFEVVGLTVSGLELAAGQGLPGRRRGRRSWSRPCGYAVAPVL